MSTMYIKQQPRRPCPHIKHRPRPLRTRNLRGFSRLTTQLKHTIRQCSRILQLIPTLRRQHLQQKRRPLCSKPSKFKAQLRTRSQESITHTRSTSIKLTNHQTSRRRTTPIHFKQLFSHPHTTRPQLLRQQPMRTKTMCLQRRLLFTRTTLRNNQQMPLQFTRKRRRRRRPHRPHRHSNTMRLLATLSTSFVQTIQYKPLFFSCVYFRAITRS